ncbi:hypothetical protein TNCV_1665641 [Trichonephila clavipes]|nr:hypothetical protein TNCV_1665641 [Trichonephila clavipes]
MFSFKKYKCLTISEKQKVTESVEEGERKVDVAKAFEIPLSSLSTILKNKEKIFSASSTLIMIDKVWRAVTPLTIHSCFKKSGFPSPNLVDVEDTLTELNAEPSLGKLFQNKI